VKPVEIVRIPNERLHVLIGKDGKTKQEIEKKANVTINVNSDGEVEITGEMADIYFAKDIVKAIGRGFEPKIALKILKEGHNLLIINLKEHFPNENAIKRIKGRVIGEEGKVKSEIETATESYISVFGNTIAIISKFDTLEFAKEAVYKILDGAPHTTVFNYLSKVKKEIVSNRLRS